MNGMTLLAGACPPDRGVRPSAESASQVFLAGEDVDERPANQRSEADHVRSLTIVDQAQP